MNRDWRCTRCDKLLGVFEGERIHLRFARGHDYLAGFPITSVCPKCRSLNEVSGPMENRCAMSSRTTA